MKRTRSCSSGTEAGTPGHRIPCSKLDLVTSVYKILLRHIIQTISWGQSVLNRINYTTLRNNLEILAKKTCEALNFKCLRRPLAMWRHSSRLVHGIIRPAPGCTKPVHQDLAKRRLISHHRARSSHIERACIQQAVHAETGLSIWLLRSMGQPQMSILAFRNCLVLEVELHSRKFLKT